MAFCSHIKITHGTTTIVDFTDKLESIPTVDGRQLVQVGQFARADTVELYPRGNESHSISFTIANKVTSAWDSIRNAFDHAASDLPRNKDVLNIVFSDSESSHYRMNSAVIETWSGTHDNLREALGVTILGSDIIKITGDTVDSDTITADSTLITADTA